MINTLLNSINTIVTQEREEKGILNNSFLLYYMDKDTYSAFKVYKRYKYMLMQIIPTLKTRRELLSIEKVAKVPTDKENEFRKEVEEEFMLHILKFFKSDNFNTYVNNGEVTKTTIQ